MNGRLLLARVASDMSGLKRPSTLTRKPTPIYPTRRTHSNTHPTKSFSNSPGQHLISPSPTPPVPSLSSLASRRQNPRQLRHSLPRQANRLVNRPTSHLPSKLEMSQASEASASRRWIMHSRRVVPSTRRALTLPLYRSSQPEPRPTLDRESSGRSCSGTWLRRWTA